MQLPDFQSERQARFELVTLSLGSTQAPPIKYLTAMQIRNNRIKFALYLHQSQARKPLFKSDTRLWLPIYFARKGKK